VPWSETLSVMYREALNDVDWSRDQMRSSDKEANAFMREYGFTDVQTTFADTRRELDRVMAEAVAASQLPVWEWRDIEIDVPPDGTFADHMLPPVGRLAAGAAAVATNWDATSIVVALELHHARNGAYPDALDDLAPGILPEVPPDPYTGEPFRYARDGAAYKLYSVGQDRQDDGGDPKKDRAFHFAE